MPTIIDELVVTLGLEGSKFQGEAQKTGEDVKRVSALAVKESKLMEEALQKHQRETGKRLKQGEEVGRQTSQQFNKFRGEVTALFATLATGFGIQQFIRGMTTANAETGRLAKNIGISTGQLGIWQEAAKRTGGSADATGGSLLGLVNQFQQFSLTGESSVLPYLRALRVNWSDTEGRMRPMKDILLDLNAAVQGMDKPRANALLAGLGFDQGTINLLESSREELTKYLSEAERLGVANEKDAQASIAYQQKIKDLEQAFNTLGRTILTEVLPDVTKFIDTITEWASNPANAHLITETAITELKEFGGFVNDTVGYVKEWHTVLEVLAAYIGGRWLLAMTVGLGPVGIAIGAIAAGLLLIKNAMQDLQPENYAADSPLWRGIPKEEQLKYPQSPESRRAAGAEGENPNPFHWWNPGSWANRPSGQGGASDDRKATVRDRLSQDLGISREASSGLVSNINYESGIAGINEKNPLIPGSRGGFGWAQWTGPRRVALEDYARQHRLDVASDEANYGFLVEELRTKYPSVLAQLRRGGISASEAANIVARGYIVPPEQTIPGHVSGAEGISKIGTPGYTPPGMTPSKGLREVLPDTIDPSLKGWIMGSAQRDSAVNDNSRTNNTNNANRASSIETNINGPITIQTSATDADGIARSIGSSLKKYSYASQANTGLV